VDKSSRDEAVGTTKGKQADLRQLAGWGEAYHNPIETKKSF